MLILGGVVALAVKLVVIVFLVRSRNAESARADAMEREAVRLDREWSVTRADLAEAVQRLSAIREVITRRPVKRRWLRIAHRVARIVDTMTDSPDYAHPLEEPTRRSA